MRYRFVIGERPQGPWHGNRLRAVEDAIAAGFAVRGPTRNHVIFQESARIEVTRARKGKEDRALLQPRVQNLGCRPAPAR